MVILELDNCKPGKHELLVPGSLEGTKPDRLKTREK
jgi:hypothetical protein